MANVYSLVETYTDGEEIEYCVINNYQIKNGEPINLNEILNVLNQQKANY
jgi:hypothetical protein